MRYIKEIINHRIGDSTTSEKVAESLDWTIALEDDQVEVAWDGSLWEKGYAPSQPIASISQLKRQERNALLDATDKYMISDFPITDEERDKYKAYRTYLRNLPASDLFPNVDVLTFEEWSK